MNAPHDIALQAPAPSWAEANQQWLVAAMAGLRERLAQRLRPDGAAAGAPLAAPPLPSLPGGASAALQRCTRVFGLSAFESELLLLAAGLELDAGLREVVGEPQARFGLALAALEAPHWDALSPDAPLRHWLLLEPGPGPLADAPLRVAERVLHYIAGVAATEPRLQGIAQVVGADATGAAGTADPALVQRIATALSADGPLGTVAVLHPEQDDPAVLRDLALACVEALDRPAMWLRSADLPTGGAELCSAARLVDREAALTGALPVLALDGGGEAAALALAGQLRSAVLWLGRPAAGLSALVPARRVLRFAVAPPAAPSGLLQRWRAAALDADESADHALHAALQRASVQFQPAAAALDGVVAQLAALPAAERAAAVWPAVREASRGGLEALAQRIDGDAGFDRLVLPPAQMAALHDIARQLRQRERVYRDWGFGSANARGQGLTALFAGESGTGKTLAAEAIAHEAGLDLYRVDLALLVSKYIGETEKNLKRLFDAAEASGAVLLFDEADALFGKRSEVKDSHDRYANLEVAYLLQRVEAYRGLAILTTNMKSALDRAFLRRIRFVVTFPFPDATARERLWRRQFPPQAPLGEVDFAALARLHLAGGHIRSIVLNAAFKAADAGGRIEHATLMDAARAEFAKLERPFHDAAGGGPA